MSNGSTKQADDMRMNSAFLNATNILQQTICELLHKALLLQYKMSGHIAVLSVVTTTECSEKCLQITIE